jgi:hypothetical protein
VPSSLKAPRSRCPEVRDARSGSAIRVTTVARGSVSRAAAALSASRANPYRVRTSAISLMRLRLRKSTPAMSSDTFVSRFSCAPYGTVRRLPARLAAPTIASWTAAVREPGDAIRTWQPNWSTCRRSWPVGLRRPVRPARRARPAARRRPSRRRNQWRRLHLARPSPHRRPQRWRPADRPAC